MARKATAIKTAETAEGAAAAGGVRDFEKFTENPFLERLVIPTRGKTVALSTGKQLGLWDRDTGEILPDTAFMATRQRVDTAEFVKIYKDQMKAMFDLSQRAYKVFGYLMHATRASNDRILFELKACQEFTDYGKASIMFALGELLAKQFIARTEAPNLYYLNPAMFFNGDRIVMMREVVRAGSKRDKQLQQNDPWQRLEAERREPPLPLIGGGMADDLNGSKEESDAA